MEKPTGFILSAFALSDCLSARAGAVFHPFRLVVLACGFPCWNGAGFCYLRSADERVGYGQVRFFIEGALRRLGEADSFLAGADFRGIRAERARDLHRRCARAVLEARRRRMRSASNPRWTETLFRWMCAMTSQDEAGKLMVAIRS